MRQLLLLRHAKSTWDDPSLSDHARPLNVRGRQAASAMAAMMRQRGMIPDLVLVSSARRTLQTLQALEPWDAPPRIEPLDALYLAPSGQMLEVLRQAVPTARSVLLVAHNPGLHEMALTLADAHGRPDDIHVRRLSESYPSGSLTEFSIASDWSELRPDQARLVRFVRPMDLAEASA